jgi:hypothetical protein
MTDSCGGSRRSELRGGIGMVEKNKNGAGERKWTEGLPIHFGWLAVA